MRPQHKDTSAPQTLRRANLACELRKLLFSFCFSKLCRFGEGVQGLNEQALQHIASAPEHHFFFYFFLLPSQKRLLVCRRLQSPEPQTQVLDLF